MAAAMAGALFQIVAANSIGLSRTTALDQIRSHAATRAPHRVALDAALLREELPPGLRASPAARRAGPPRDPPVAGARYAMRSRSSFAVKVGRSTPRSFIFSAIWGPWFHIADGHEDR